jgi:hypothetical protein
VSLLRVYGHRDYQAVDDIYRKYHQDNFGIPNLNHTLRNVVYENDGGRIVGFGMLKLIPEAIMVLDLEATPREKKMALDNLIGHAILTASIHDYEHVHAFVQGEFSDRLKKHYGFSKCEGEAIYLPTERS